MSMLMIDFPFVYVFCLFNLLPIHITHDNIMLAFSYVKTCNVQPTEDFINGKQKQLQHVFSSLLLCSWEQTNMMILG